MIYTDRFVNRFEKTGKVVAKLWKKCNEKIVTNAKGELKQYTIFYSERIKKQMNKTIVLQIKIRKPNLLIKLL